MIIDNTKDFINGTIDHILPELKSIIKFLDIIYTDGVNEHGLSIGFLDMDTVRYQVTDINDDFVLMPLFLCNWLLSNYQNIAEIKEKLPNINFYI